MLAKSPKRAHAPARKNKVAPPEKSLTAGDPIFGLRKPDGPDDLTSGRLLDRLSSDQRKKYPLTSGVMDYFPDALAEVSHVSWGGNAKHNPGQPLHWSRGKSGDHADCIGRHLQQRGTFDTIVIDGKSERFRHTAALAWRALALLQEEIEADEGTICPRGAVDDAAA